jgi:predicted kinase
VPATHVLSPDALLFDADRYAWSEARAGRAWKQVREDLARLLQTGRSVALDATSPRAADRAPFVRAARAAGYRTVAIFFDVPREAAEARDRDRPGKDRPVGPEVVRRIADEVVPPTGEEGFDEVWEVGEEGRLVAGTRPCGE